jgi:hypothetical protein
MWGWGDVGSYPEEELLLFAVRLALQHRQRQQEQTG